VPDHLPSQPTSTMPSKILSFTPPVPWLTAEMDEEEVTITMGLGVLLREAALLEYTLHGLLVHLKNKRPAYSHQAQGTGGQLAEMCLKHLKGMKDDLLLEKDGADLIEHLTTAVERFEVRHHFVHGGLAFDDESQQWLTFKGSKVRSTMPEIRFTTSSEPWELAAELHHLNMKILELDIKYFGETVEGHTRKASVKR
jgi:hypothetical protein